MYCYFSNKKNIISKQQYGFMRKIGTKNTLQRLTSILNCNLVRNIKSIATFLDPQKASNTVDRNTLLKKLYRYGMRDSAYSLTSSYLTGRKQRIKLNNVYSNYRSIDAYPRARYLSLDHLYSMLKIYLKICLMAQ